MRYLRLIAYVLLWTLILSALPPVIVPARAQAACPLRINEVMYNPAGSAAAEWVELYVASEIATPTTFYLTDLEGEFKTFSLPVSGLDPVPSGAYVVVHYDGDPAQDGTVVSTGLSTVIHFYRGGGSGRLNNTGDDVVLYIGTDTTGTPCDYIAFASGSGIDGAPSGFTWISQGPGASASGKCANPSSSSKGTSISLTPNGSLTDDSCAWVQSGEGRPGVPDSDTGAPHTQGYDNNNALGPTAVALSAFRAYSAPGSGFLRLLAFLAVWSLLFQGGRWLRRRASDGP